MCTSGWVSPSTRFGNGGADWTGWAIGLQVAARAAALKPDLFHVHEPELLGPVIARAGSTPVIWDVHESYLDVLAERRWIPGFARPAARIAWNWRERRLVARCAGVVVVTERIANGTASCTQESPS